VNPEDIKGIDLRSLSGFTARELLIEAAGVATGEEIPAIKKTAFEMLDLFKKPGTPVLTSGQAEAYIDMISLARDYEEVVITEEPDAFATTDERRTYAMLSHVVELMHAVRSLGEH
jgi:hypothetical protein